MNTPHTTAIRQAAEEVSDWLETYHDLVIYGSGIDDVEGIISRRLAPLLEQAERERDDVAQQLVYSETGKRDAIARAAAAEEQRDELCAAMTDIGGVGGSLENSAIPALRIITELRTKLVACEAERDRLHALINTPETADFVKAVQLEAAHQRERWPAECDAGKTDADWFWLLGYLAGKALNAFRYDQNPEQFTKGLHHIITTAAACANWHHQRTVGNNMRPGIAEPAHLSKQEPAP